MMKYKILKIEGDTITMEDHVTRDEWGKPTIMQFVMEDTSTLLVGMEVELAIVIRRDV